MQNGKELEKQIEAWQKNIHSILQEAQRKLASKTKESFRKKPEELFWNLEIFHREEICHGPDRPFSMPFFGGPFVGQPSIALENG